MNRIAAYCYGISAACLACIIENSADKAFWDSRPIIGGMLAASVPFCVATGWLLEHRPIKVHSVFYKITCGFSMFFGMASLAGFILNISTPMGLGFGVGIILALWSIQGLSEPFPDQYTKNNPERKEPHDR